jgi:enediyne biosynthesis protein CalE5
MNKEQTIKSTNISKNMRISEHHNLTSFQDHRNNEQNQQKENWNFTGRAWRKWWRDIERSANPVSQRLLEISAVKKGDKVLDLATGYGEPAISAAIKVGPSGFVTGIDLSSEMLSIAKERAQFLGLDNVEFKQGDIQSIELQKEYYESVLSRWGLMFIPNLEKVLNKIRASIKPPGHFAAAVWGSPERVPLLSLPFKAANKLFNSAGENEHLQIPIFKCGTIGPFSLSDTNSLRSLFEQASFVNIRIECIEVSFELPSAEDFARTALELSPPLKAMLAQFSDMNEKRDKLIETIAETTREFAANNYSSRQEKERIILTNDVILVAAQSDT